MANVLDESGLGGAKQRPTFLTVLCILSFIGSPLSLISNILAYFTYSGEAGAMLLATMEAFGIHINPLGYLITGILSLGSLFGAIQMWGLKKMGYFIYVGATVASLIVSFVMLGGLALGGFAIIGILLAAVFPVLYGLNLKHME